MDYTENRNGDFLIGVMCFFMACLIVLLLAADYAVLHLCENYRADLPHQIKTQEKLKQGASRAFNNKVLDVVQLINNNKDKLEHGTK